MSIYQQVSPSPTITSYLTGGETYALVRASSLLYAVGECVENESLITENITVLDSALGRQRGLALGDSSLSSFGMADLLDGPGSIPVIEDQSSSALVTRLGTLSLFVTASGIGLSYQWSLDDDPILDAIESTYEKPLATGSDCGSYTCTVTNSFGDATTAPIIITMLPVILFQSSDTIVVRGGMLSLFVTADGSAPIAYQWYKNDNLIPDGIDATYTKVAIFGSDCGIYTCRVTNDA